MVDAITSTKKEKGGGGTPRGMKSNGIGGGTSVQKGELLCNPPKKDGEGFYEPSEKGAGWFGECKKQGK